MHTVILGQSFIFSLDALTDYNPTLMCLRTTAQLLIRTETARGYVLHGCSLPDYLSSASRLAVYRAQKRANHWALRHPNPNLGALVIKLLTFTFG